MHRHYYRRAIANPNRTQVSRPYLSLTDPQMCVTLSRMVGAGRQRDGPLLRSAVSGCIVLWSYRSVAWASSKSEELATSQGDASLIARVFPPQRLLRHLPMAR